MSTDQEKRDRGALRHAAEHERPRKRNPVLFYLVILFAAAFLLLLFSYFAQQRSNREAMDNLQQTSNSAAQTLDQILQERDELKIQIGELEQQVEDLKSQTTELDSARRIQNNNINQLIDQAEAMQWFWQIDDYYARGYYTRARNLIEEFEALGLKDSLPAENTTGTDRFSPAERYQEIYDALY